MTRWHRANPWWNELQTLGNALPWRHIQSLQHEVNRLFDRVTDSPGHDGGNPPVNVWEDGENLTVEVELPGATPDSLEVFITADNQLTIKGERKAMAPDNGVWHRQERGSGSFGRTLSLPFEVDRDQIGARLENGVLFVKLAKHQSAKPQKIHVKAD